MRLVSARLLDGAEANRAMRLDHHTEASVSVADGFARLLVRQVGLVEHLVAKGIDQAETEGISCADRLYVEIELIACHSVNNLVSVAVTAWGASGAPPAPVAVAVGLPVACGCLWAVWQRAGSPPVPGRPPPGDGLQPPAGSDDA